MENPLLRSGLALAGANEYWRDGNEGILTAMETTGLCLWGDVPVALSACDTGVGQITNGDGVYGLRRALVLAGSESQVISLWPVSDLATRALMVDFYQALRRGEGRSEALRQAQLNLLRDEAEPPSLLGELYSIWTLGQSQRGATERALTRKGS